MDAIILSALFESQGIICCDDDLTYSVWFRNSNKVYMKPKSTTTLPAYVNRVTKYVAAHMLGIKLTKKLMTPKHINRLKEFRLTVKFSLLKIFTESKCIHSPYTPLSILLEPCNISFDFKEHQYIISYDITVLPGYDSISGTNKEEVIIELVKIINSYVKEDEIIYSDEFLNSVIAKKPIAVVQFAAMKLCITPNGLVPWLEDELIKYCMKKFTDIDFYVDDSW